MAKRETGIQFLARLGSRPSLSGLESVLFDRGPHGGDVVEIYGEEGTGKTELLLHLLTRCLMPAEWNGIKLNGHKAAVLYIDLDNKFSVLRLAALMERYIHAKAGTNGNIDTNMVETFVTECLQNLHVVRCSCTSQLLITLHNLETVICNEPNISAIMVDSISAFYWTDRSHGGDNAQSQDNMMKLCTEMFSKLVNEYNLMLFATKYAVFKKKVQPDVFCDKYNLTTDNNSGKEQQNNYSLTSDLDQEHAEFMCKPWQRLVTHRLIVVQVADRDGDTQQGFMVGGDCVRGNTMFSITDLGVQFKTVT